MPVVRPARPSPPARVVPRRFISSPRAYLRTADPPFARRREPRASRAPRRAPPHENPLLSTRRVHGIFVPRYSDHRLGHRQLRPPFVITASSSAHVHARRRRPLHPRSPCLDSRYLICFLSVKLVNLSFYSSHAIVGPKEAFSLPLVLFLTSPLSSFFLSPLFSLLFSTPPVAFPLSFSTSLTFPLRLSSRLSLSAILSFSPFLSLSLYTYIRILYIYLHIYLRTLIYTYYTYVNPHIFLSIQYIRTYIYILYTLYIIIYSKR